MLELLLSVEICPVDTCSVPVPDPPWFEPQPAECEANAHEATGNLAV